MRAMPPRVVTMLASGIYNPILLEFVSAIKDGQQLSVHSSFCSDVAVFSELDQIVSQDVGNSICPP